MSRFKYLAIPALALVALTPSISPSSAAPSSASGLMTGKLTAPQSLVEKAGYGYCWRWNAICRDRWVAGWRYRRCMVAHGC